jgi:hypothetical protein
MLQRHIEDGYTTKHLGDCRTIFNEWHEMAKLAGFTAETEGTGFVLDDGMCAALNTFDGTKVDNTVDAGFGKLSEQLKNLAMSGLGYLDDVQLAFDEMQLRV